MLFTFKVRPFCKVLSTKTHIRRRNAKHVRDPSLDASYQIILTVSSAGVFYLQAQLSFAQLQLVGLEQKMAMCEGNVQNSDLPAIKEKARPC